MGFRLNLAGTANILQLPKGVLAHSTLPTLPPGAGFLTAAPDSRASWTRPSSGPLHFWDVNKKANITSENVHLIKQQQKPHVYCCHAPLPVWPFWVSSVSLKTDCFISDCYMPGWFACFSACQRLQDWELCLVHLHRVLPLGPTASLLEVLVQQLLAYPADILPQHMSSQLS